MCHLLIALLLVGRPGAADDPGREPQGMPLPVGLWVAGPSTIHARVAPPRKGRDEPHHLHVRVKVYNTNDGFRPAFLRPRHDGARAPDGFLEFDAMARPQPPGVLPPDGFVRSEVEYVAPLPEHPRNPPAGVRVFGQAGGKDQVAEFRLADDERHDAPEPRP